MRSTTFRVVLLAGLAGLSGCQCCPLTENYACLIDWISDHERDEEKSYHPGWDLNRIGRPDWCCCRLNRRLCPCACSRVRPLPCGHIVCRESVMLPEKARHPDWSRQPPSQAGPGDSPPEEPESEDAPLPPELQKGDVPQFPDPQRAKRDLQLP